MYTAFPLGLPFMYRLIEVCVIMIKNVIITLTFLSCFVRAFGTELSETNNGFFLAIGGARSGTNEPIQYDEELVYLPYYTLYKSKTPDANHLIDLQYPDVQHGLKLNLLGPDGKEVPRTSIGKRIGSMWDKLHDRRDSKMWFDVSAGYSYDSSVGADGGCLIYPINMLFKMKDPGIYTLEIQMQMLRYTPSLDPEEQHKNLIRFPPMRIKIEKPRGSE
jgi:hypothetical protein